MVHNTGESQNLWCTANFIGEKNKTIGQEKKKSITNTLQEEQKRKLDTYFIQVLLGVGGL